MLNPFEDMQQNQPPPSDIGQTDAPPQASNAPASPDMGGDSPLTSFNQPSQKTGGFGANLKDALQRFAYYGSQAGMKSVGLPTDFEIQKQQVEADTHRRQLQIQQQNADTERQKINMIPYVDPTTGQVQMVRAQDWARLKAGEQKNATSSSNNAVTNATKQAITDKTLNSKESIAADANAMKAQQLKWGNYYKGITAKQKEESLGIARARLDQSVNGATQNIKTQGQMASMLLDHVPNIQTEIADLGAKGKLGPLAGRYSEFMAGKVGDGDPDYVQLRTDLGLFQTALMKAHVGARGSEKIMEHFKNLLDSGKFSPEALNAAMNTVKGYLITYKAGGEGKFGGGTPASAPPVGAKVRDYTDIK
jgi:hypothetical protein